MSNILNCKRGSTVIFNDEYISEVIRYKDLWQHKSDIETIPATKEKYQKKYEEFVKKLEWAENFQDTLDFVQNMEIPEITVIKTMNGYEIPARYLQVI